ncbi:hypothetical protein [Sorangium sp. So ce887]|uniref:hypothetical protein n=1 Tax=Sorangium sp. So ce887 TaxID=3133324 RepID=UPI003F6319B0
MPKFIALHVRNALVMHGYDADNTEGVEQIQDEPFVDKLIAVERIQSDSERYVLVTSSHGRALHWEYEGGLAALTGRLARAGLVVA